MQVVLCGGFFRIFQDQGSSNVWGGWGSGRDFFLHVKMKF